MMKKIFYIISELVFVLILVAAITVWAQETGPTVTQIPLASSSNTIIANPSTHEVYVGGNNANLTIIDDNSRTVADTVTLIGDYASVNDASVNPITNKVYVSIWFPGQHMNEIDGATHAVMEINDGLTYQVGVDVNTATNKIYSLGYRYTGDNPPYETDISIVDGETHAYTLIENIGGTWNAQLVANSATNKTYITDDYYNRVTVIDGNTQTVKKTVNVQTGPVDIALNPLTNRIYVANADSQSVSVINGETDTVELHVTVGITPTALAINTDQNKIYVANSGSNNISVINGVTNNVESTIDVDGIPSDIAVHPDLGRIYVPLGNVIAIIDDLSHDIIIRTVGNDARDVSVIEGSNNVYVGEYRLSGNSWVSILTEYRTHILTNTSTSLVYNDTQGNATIIDIPIGAVTETTTLVYTPVETPTTPSDFSFAGHAFDLDSYHGDVPLFDFTFEKPITVTLHYSDDDVADIDDEGTLVLQWWNGSSNQWEDALCTGHTYDRHPDENWLTIPICHLSQFALYGETSGFKFYLPMLLR